MPALRFYVCKKVRDRLSLIVQIAVATLVAFLRPVGGMGTMPCYTLIKLRVRRLVITILCFLVCAFVSKLRIGNLLAASHACNFILILGGSMLVAASSSEDNTPTPHHHTTIRQLLSGHGCPGLHGSMAEDFR